jgi:hypothetical protein
MKELQFIDIPKSLGKSLKIKKSGLKSPKSRLSSFLETGITRKTLQNEIKLSDYDTQVENIRKGIKVPKDATSDLMVVTTELNAQLNNLIPANLSTTLYGVDERPPSDFEKSKFIRQLRVIANPEHVLDLLAVGSLSPLEVETLQSFYPEYYQKLVEDTLEAVSSLSDTVPPPSTTKALSVLLQVPRLTPEILQTPKEEGEGNLNLQAAAEQAETDTQKVMS